MLALNTEALYHITYEDLVSRSSMDEEAYDQALQLEDELYKEQDLETDCEAELSDTETLLSHIYYTSKAPSIFQDCLKPQKQQNSSSAGNSPVTKSDYTSKNYKKNEGFSPDTNSLITTPSNSPRQFFPKSPTRKRYNSPHKIDSKGEEPKVYIIDSSSDEYEIDSRHRASKIPEKPPENESKYAIGRKPISSMRFSNCFQAKEKISLGDPSDSYSSEEQSDREMKVDKAIQPISNVEISDQAFFSQQIITIHPPSSLPKPNESPNSYNLSEKNTRKNNRYFVPQYCNVCRKQGHSPRNCPEVIEDSDEVDDSEEGEFDIPKESIWRRYILNPGFSMEGRPPVTLCYLCGSKAHSGDHCSEKRLGNYVRTSLAREDLASRRNSHHLFDGNIMYERNKRYNYEISNSNNRRDRLEDQSSEKVFPSRKDRKEKSVVYESYKKR
ncbi:hypothetical protein G9A89_023576 [Geosiphon pyriformis]|nr:hypothetical protein G9A89_023576 [Geosiphon pyriformis]